MDVNKVKKISLIIGIEIIMAITIFSIIIYVYNNYIKTKGALIQIGSTTEERMMGYILLTENNEVIIIDGGNYEDGEKLQRYIEYLGGKVNYWYITHYHSDHTGAFNYIVNETDIEIENIYHSLVAENNVKEREPIRYEHYQEYIQSINNPNIKY